MTATPLTITEKTRVPVSLIVGGVAVTMPIIGWFTWLAVTINEIQGTLEAMQQDIAEIRTDGTTRTAMQAWVREFKAMNPEIQVPDLAE